MNARHNPFSYVSIIYSIYINRLTDKATASPQNNIDSKTDVDRSGKMGGKYCTMIHIIKVLI